MKKITILFLIFTLSFSQLAALETFAETNDLIDFENEFKIIQDKDNFMHYQIKENGDLYEYEEVIDDDVIYTKKYKIKGSSKILVEDFSTTLILEDEEFISTTIDNINQTTKKEILSFNNDSDDSIMPIANSRASWPAGYTQQKASLSGHSYAYNWNQNKGISRLGARDIIVKLPDKKFNEYTRIVDSLKNQEYALIPFVGGAQGLGEIIKAIGKGKVTLATLKSVLKKLGKSIPGIGTLASMVTYFNTLHKANVSRDSLKGTVHHNGFG